MTLFSDKQFNSIVFGFGGAACIALFLRYYEPPPSPPIERTCNYRLIEHEDGAGVRYRPEVLMSDGEWRDMTGAMPAEPGDYYWVLRRDKAEALKFIADEHRRNCSPESEAIAWNSGQPS